jgi:hypothetical protein
MASSVSSERAFSSAGITISKRPLNAVTVEALQFLKCMYRRELNFREFLSSACAEGVQEEPEKEGDVDKVLLISTLIVPRIATLDSIPIPSILA